MSLEHLRIYSQSRLLTAMNAQYPAIPIQFDNAPFVQPDTMWGGFSIMDGNSKIVSLGTQKVDRHVGFVQFDVLAPQNSGTAVATQVAEFVGRTFRDVITQLPDQSKVVFKSPQFISRGMQNGFYRMCMRCAYWRDEPPT